MVRGVDHLGVASTSLRPYCTSCVPERKEKRRSADPGALLPLDRLSVGGRFVHVRGKPLGVVLEQVVRVGLMSGVGGDGLAQPSAGWRSAGVACASPPLDAGLSICSQPTEPAG